MDWSSRNVTALVVSRSCRPRFTTLLLACESIRTTDPVRVCCCFVLPVLPPDLSLSLSLSLSWKLEFADGEVKIDSLGFLPFPNFPPLFSPLA